MKTFNKERFLDRQEFLTWLNSLPKDREFRYLDGYECLISTWGKECGAPRPSTSGFDFKPDRNPKHMMDFLEYPLLHTIDDVIGSVHLVFNVADIQPLFEEKLRNL